MIDHTDLAVGASTGPNLYKLMTQMMERQLEEEKKPRPKYEPLFLSQKVFDYLDRQDYISSVGNVDMVYVPLKGFFRAIIMRTLGNDNGHRYHNRIKLTKDI